MAMTPDDLLKWLTLGTMGSQVVTGLAGAGRSSAERAYQQQQDLYNRQQAARQASMAWLNSQLQGQEGRAETLARLTPLGAEQGYAQRQALLGSMARNIAGMPLPSGYGGTLNPAAGMNLGSLNDAATAGSLGQYQRLRAGIDPNFQFMSLGNLGLGDAGSAADRSVADYAKTMGEQRLARENAMTQFLVDQSRAAGLGAQPAGQAGQGEAPKKKGSKWATVGRIAAAAAPFVASGMKNVSPQIMKTIQAASGAAQGALSGGGAGGAALGAVSGYMAPAVQPTGIGVRNAILNPRAIGTIASAGLPGVYGTIGQMVSSQLRGPADRLPTTVPGEAFTQGAIAPFRATGAWEEPVPLAAEQVAAARDAQQQAILDEFAPQGNAPVARTRAAVAPPRRTTKTAAPTSTTPVDLRRAPQPTPPLLPGLATTLTLPNVGYATTPSGPVPLPLGEEWRNQFRAAEAANAMGQATLANQAAQREYWRTKAITDEIGQLEAQIARAQAARPALGSPAAQQLWRDGQRQIIAGLQARLAVLRQQSPQAAATRATTQGVPR